MKYRFLTAASAAFTLIALPPANAADSSTTATAATSWSGCYVGANVGYIHGDADATDAPFIDGPFAGSGFSWNSADAPYERIFNDDNGMAGGIEAGCDRQFDFNGTAFVLGGVVDFSLTNLGATSTSAISSDTHTSFDIDWAASARLRAGIAASDFLFYATGGYALANVDVRAYSRPTLAAPGEMDVSGGGTEGGWVAGAGIEWRVKPEWSVGIEYLHYDFGTITATGAASFPPGAFPRFENDVEVDTIRVGLKWRM